MRALRTGISAGLIVALVGALLAGSAGAASSGSEREKGSRSGGGGGSGLSFAKPVTLTSFAPARTAVGTVYTATRGDEQSDHEWSAEPSIQVDKKGTIYVAGTCCVVPAAPVWISDDGGKTFRELETPGHLREWTIGAEGDLAVDENGHTYFIDTYIPGLVFTRWSDHGKTWDFTAPAAGPVPGFDDRPWITWGNDTLYLYVNHVSHTAVYESTDGGMTWGSSRILSWRGNPLGQPFFPAHLSADRKKGTLWISGLVEEEGKTVLGSWVMDSIDGEPVESVVSPAQRRGGFSPIFNGATTVDAAGNGYTTWSTWDDGGCDVYYASSTNKGKKWNKPVKVDTGPGCATFSWITSGDDGNIALAWYETPTVKDVAATNFFEQLTRTKTVYGGIDVSLIAYQDEVPADAPWYLHAAAVTKAHSKNPQIREVRVDTGTPVMKGPLERELWDFLQVAIGPDGRIHIAFAKKFKDGAPQTWYVTSKGGPRLK